MAHFQCPMDISIIKWNLRDTTRPFSCRYFPKKSYLCFQYNGQDSYTPPCPAFYYWSAVSLTFLSHLTSNSFPPDLNLLSTEDYSMSHYTYLVKLNYDRIVLKTVLCAHKESNKFKFPTHSLLWLSWHQNPTKVFPGLWWITSKSPNVQNLL
jgi:hypothetical protein